MQQVYPYVKSAEVHDALKPLEDVCVQLNDQSKISAIMQTASKTFTKGSAAAIGALAQSTNALRIAIEYKDIAKDSHVTKEFLTGAKHKAGYAQMFFKRLAFLEFLESMIKASTGPHAEEVFVCIFRRDGGDLGDHVAQTSQQIPSSPLHSQRFASSVEANNTTSLEPAQQQRL